MTEHHFQISSNPAVTAATAEAIRALHKAYGDVVINVEAGLIIVRIRNEKRRAS